MICALYLCVLDKRSCLQVPEPALVSSLSIIQVRQSPNTSYTDLNMNADVCYVCTKAGRELYIKAYRLSDAAWPLLTTWGRQSNNTPLIHAHTLCSLRLAVSIATTQVHSSVLLIEIDEASLWFSANV